MSLHARQVAGRAQDALGGSAIRRGQPAVEGSREGNPAQRRLLRVADSGIRVRQLRALQEAAEDRIEVRYLAGLGEGINRATADRSGPMRPTPVVQASVVQRATEAPVQRGRKNRRGGSYRPSKKDMKWQRQMAKAEGKRARNQQRHIEREAMRAPRNVGGGGLGGGNPLVALLLLMMVSSAYGIQVSNNITIARQAQGNPLRLPGGRSRGRGTSGDSGEDRSRALTLYEGPPSSQSLNVTSMVFPSFSTPSLFSSLSSMFNATGHAPPVDSGGALVEYRPPIGLPPLSSSGPRSVGTPEGGSRFSTLFEGLDTLRVGVQHGRGFGHQDATVAMIQDLASLGYSGQIHMVFPNITGSEGVPTAMKLAELIPGFDPHNANQTLGLGGLDLLATEQQLFSSTTTPQQRLPLALVAASEDLTIPWLQDLNVENALMLQPYNWVPEEEGRYLLGPEGQQSLGLPLSSTYQYPVVDPWESTQGDLSERYAALEAFAIEAMGSRSPEMLAKLPGLLQVMNATRAGAAELMPIYGLHHPAVSSKSADILGNLASGSRSFLRQQEDPLPVIMMILSDLPGGVPDLGVNTTSALIQSPGFAASVGALSPYDILAVETGRLPRQLFQLIYKSATLPGTFEGANTANLLQVLGKPFLSVYEGMTELPTGAPDVSRGFQIVHDVSGKLKEDILGPLMETYQSYLGAEASMPSWLKSNVRERLRQGEGLSLVEEEMLVAKLIDEGMEARNAKSAALRLGSMLRQFSRLNLSEDTREAMRDFDVISPDLQMVERIVSGVSTGAEDWFGQVLVGSRNPLSEIGRYYASVHEGALSRENRQVLRALEYYQENRKV